MRPPRDIAVSAALAVRRRAAHCARSARPDEVQHHGRPWADLGSIHRRGSINGHREGTMAEPTEPQGPTRIVGIGASAGVLESLEQLFQNLPSDTGMGFVVVQHLSPDFRSVMDELLARQT